MALLDIFKRKYPLYVYTENEFEEYDAYIQKAFGKYENVFHELVSPDIHLDVAIIPPSEKRDFCTLVTMGAGAYKMKVPRQLKAQDLSYAEYMIFLPKDWKITSDDENDYWPIRMLKDVARLPVRCKSWLAFGHTVHGNSEAGPFAESTKLNSSVLLDAADLDGNACGLRLSSGKKINFYTLLPLYQEELEFKFENGLSALLELFPEGESLAVINPVRKNYCSGQA